MKSPLYKIKTNLLIKNLCFIYWHITAVLLWLQVLVLIGGVGIAFFDKQPVWESMYLAFITSLTVGYGELTPQTVPFKLIAIGIGFTGILVTGIIFAASIRAFELTLEEQKAESKLTKNIQFAPAMESSMRCQIELH